MSKYLPRVEYILFGLIIFYAISTSLFIAAPFMHDPFDGFKFNNDFNEGILFLCLFLAINLLIAFFIFLIENDNSKKIIIFGLIVFIIATIFALIQWGLINLANNTLNGGFEDETSNWAGGFIFPLFLNLILVIFFNEFLKWIIIITNRNKPAKCFIVTNSFLFLLKNKYLEINNTVLLTYNKEHQIDIIIFDQFEDELLDFGGEHKSISRKSIDKNTKDILDDFLDERIEIITKPNKNAHDLIKYINEISRKTECPVLCILINGGVYLPTFKGEVPNNIKHLKKSYLVKNLKNNLMIGTKLSFEEIKERI